MLVLTATDFVILSDSSKFGSTITNHKVIRSVITLQSVARAYTLHLWIGHIYTINRNTKFTKNSKSNYCVLLIKPEN